MEVLAALLAQIPQEPRLPQSTSGGLPTVIYTERKDRY